MVKINKTDFGNTSILAVGDLYQLSPVLKGPVFQCHQVLHLSQFALNGWDDFRLRELTQILYQKHLAPMLTSIHVKQPVKCSAEDMMLGPVQYI